MSLRTNNTAIPDSRLRAITLRAFSASKLACSCIYVTAIAPSGQPACRVLHEYIRRRKQMQILDLFGTIDYREDYDYQASRRRDQTENER